MKRTAHTQLLLGLALLLSACTFASATSEDGQHLPKTSEDRATVPSTTELGPAEAEPTAPESTNPKPIDPEPNESAQAVMVLDLRQAVTTSSDGHFQLEVRPWEIESNGSQPDPLKFHRWTVRIFDNKSKKTVQPELLAVSGGMQAHGHGLPTIPQLSDYDSSRGFIIKDVRFNMAGDWFLRVDFSVKGAADYAIVHFRITPSLQTAKENTDRALELKASITAPADQQNESIWSEQEIALLQTLILTESYPYTSMEPSPKGFDSISATNTISKTPATDNQSTDTQGTDKPVRNNLAKEELGHQLFFDKRLSPDLQFSCATCHQPERYFTDSTSTANGRTTLNRNTLSIVGASNHDWFYWDGRSDSLWSQALVPLEAVDEMNNSRLHLAQTIKTHYQNEYENIYGVMPEIPASPKHASPIGDVDAKAAWSAIPTNIQTNINRVFSNIGKAIASYEALLQPAPSGFDRFVIALTESDTRNAQRILTPAEQQGIKLFISERTQCLNCHNGPSFSNRGFHNIGTGLIGNLGADMGRSRGIEQLMNSEFNCSSRFNQTSDHSDSSQELHENATQPCDHLRRARNQSAEEMMLGAFRVPTLRGVSASAPYFHDGRFSNLDEVVNFYTNPPAYINTRRHELPIISSLSKSEREALIAFLMVLGDSIAANEKWLQAPE